VTLHAEYDPNINYFQKKKKEKQLELAGPLLALFRL
jgi:hypothetical protein